jgi:hypothetical protein
MCLEAGTRIAARPTFIKGESKVKMQALVERKIELQEERGVLVASVCAGDRYVPERITSLVARLDEIKDELHAVRRELQS